MQTFHTHHKIGAVCPFILADLPRKGKENMASTRELYTKDGQRYYEIIVSMGRGKPQLTSKWYPQKGWSQKTIDRELEKEKVEFERKCKAGEVVSRKDAKDLEQKKALEEAKIQTLKQYCEAVYMPDLAVRCSENTRSSYQANLNNWIYPALGDFKLPDITAAQIEALFVSMQKQKKAHSTVLKVYTILKGVFKKACKGKGAAENPMLIVDRPRPRKGEIRKKKPEAYTAKEILYIRECLEEEPLTWKALIYFMSDSGLRRGECCGLRWKDLDFKKCTARICGSLGYTADKGVFYDSTKADKVWTIDVDPYVIDLLRQLKLEQMSKGKLSTYVFTQKNSTEPIHPQSPTKYLKTMEKKYGIHHFHPHKLRHSFASIAITNGADVASVSEKLGHSDPAVTLRMYTHANQESIKRASNIFRNALKNDSEQQVKEA